MAIVELFTVSGKKRRTKRRWGEVKGQGKGELNFKKGCPKGYGYWWKEEVEDGFKQYTSLQFLKK